MTIQLPDTFETSSGMTECQLRIEFACWMFDSGRLSLWPAAQVAGLSRVDFEDELAQRSIAAYRPTVEDLESDLAAFRRIERPSDEKGHAAA